MLRLFIISLTCFAPLLLVACGDLERKIDVSLYGSEEQARSAHAQFEVEQAKREHKKQRNMEKDLFELITEEREKKRFKTAHADDAVQDFARTRAKEISDGFTAYRPNGKRVQGEFHLSGLIKPESVLYTWMTDIEARKTLQAPDLLRCGVGVFKKGGTYYWVLIPQN